MTSHILDFTLLGGNFSTPEMRAVWDERRRLQRQLDVERELALAEGELGIIPQEAAARIAAAADAELFDFAEMERIARTARHSLMPVIKVLQRLAGEAGEFVHYGATTQDIVDTATALQLQEAHALLKRRLRALLRQTARQAGRCKSVAMAGRTHGVQALPITFGFKLAVLLCELGRHLERLQELEKRVFAGVLAGAVGTYAALGSAGPEVERRVLARLGLAVPEICWHASRDRFAEYASALALLSGTLGKMGHELYTLMATETDEVAEPFDKGTIGSSTMPQKRNPAALEGLASLTRPVFHAAELARDAMLMEHERDAMAWRAEWIALPEITQYVDNQLLTAVRIMEGLAVKPENMLRNLRAGGGLIAAERLMFVLGEHYGKQTAHELVYRLAMQAQEQGEAFAEAVQRDGQVRRCLSAAAVAELLDPVNYLGEAVRKTEDVLRLARDKGWLEAAE